MINKSSFFVSVGLVFLFVFTFSCEKDDLNPEYPFTITVKTLADSTLAGNTLVVAYAPGDNNTTFLEGYTDEQGVVSFEYDKAAILEIRATRGESPDFTWIGCTDVRLEANTEVSKTVYIRPYNPSVIGCDQ